MPGTLSSTNWSWRMKEDNLSQSIKTKLAEITKHHKRNGSEVNNLLEGKAKPWI